MIVADLKLYSPIIGIQGYSASYPCPYCHIDKDHLHLVGTPRTFGDCRQLNSEWVQAGEKLSKCKDFKNCRHRPLLDSIPDAKRVIEKNPPPQLHLMSGNTNTINKGLEAEGPRYAELAKEWAKRIGISREGYHGGDFAGNACRKMLRPESLQVLSDLAPNDSKVRAYIEAFQALDLVVKECFGFYYNPQTDHTALVAKYREKYGLLGLRITPKVHIVAFHVLHFMQTVGDSLGVYSEQAGETIHSKWVKTWSKFQVTAMDNPSYCDKLRRAVGDFSSKRLI